MTVSSSILGSGADGTGLDGTGVLREATSDSAEIARGVTSVLSLWVSRQANREGRRVPEKTTSDCIGKVRDDDLDGSWVPIKLAQIV